MLPLALFPDRAFAGAAAATYSHYVTAMIILSAGVGLAMALATESAAATLTGMIVAARAMEGRTATS